MAEAVVNAYYAEAEFNDRAIDEKIVSDIELVIPRNKSRLSRTIIGTAVNQDYNKSKITKETHILKRTEFFKPKNFIHLGTSTCPTENSLFSNSNK